MRVTAIDADKLEQQLLQLRYQDAAVPLSGTSNPYTLTASEDVGTGFVVAPLVGTAVNPETVFFK